VRKIGLLVASAYVACLPAVASARSQSAVPQFSNPSASERIEIDGSKNPELVPQWNVWAMAFRLALRSTPDGIPRALGLSAAQTGLLLAQARAHTRADADCRDAVLRLKPLVGVAAAEEINERTRRIQLTCRHKTLEARDRLLAGVGPDASTAIAMWVESLKGGIQITVPKQELEHFRRPE
jgi:hypothetical protein